MNIWLMSVTFDVSQLERPGMDVRLPQPSNMNAMLVTSEMSRFVTSMVEASSSSERSAKRNLESCGAFTPLAM